MTLTSSVILVTLVQFQKYYTAYNMPATSYMVYIFFNLQNSKDAKDGRKILSKMLEVLPLRGSGVFEKFCDVLLLNGHPFIADFLRDEGKKRV